MSGSKRSLKNAGKPVLRAVRSSAVESRYGVDAANLPQLRDGPYVLLITAGLADGGAVQGREAARRLAASGLKSLSLYPQHVDDGTELRVVLADRLNGDHLIYELPRELERLRRLLAERNVAKIEIHDVFGLDSRIFSLVAELAAPYTVMAHDYGWLCPRRNLINGLGRFCGLPLDPTICTRCVAIDGLTQSENFGVAALRERSAAIFTDAERVITPCEDMASRFALFAPDANFEVRQPEKPAKFGAVRPREPGARLRVAVIGRIDAPRGYEILLACARDAAMRDLPILFIIIGDSYDDPALLATGRVAIAGARAGSEAVETIRAQDCQIAFFPTLWPEGWSYDLTSAWRAGLPALAFDFGTTAQRIKATGFGRAIPFTMDAAAINAEIMKSDAALASRVGAGETSEAEEGTTLPATAGIGASETLGAQWRVTLIDLEPGLYVFSLSGAPGRATYSEAAESELSLTLAEIALPDGERGGGNVAFLGQGNSGENRLATTDDSVFVRIFAGAATLLVKRARMADPQAGPVIVECRRLAPLASGLRTGPTQADSVGLRMQITAHIQSRGDLHFVGPDWAGCAGDRLWIEAFSIRPLEGFLPAEIEYKALTGSGFETPWVSSGAMCGTRGTANPLIGFAVRLRGSAAERYECRYLGAFLGSGVAGPFRNGAPCKSHGGPDPLTAIELRIIERTETVTIAMPEPPKSGLPDYEIVYGSY